MLGNKKKRFFQLVEGDKIWIVTREDNTIHEATVWGDSCEAPGLPFPEYCSISIYCPELCHEVGYITMCGLDSRFSDGTQYFISEKKDKRYRKDVIKDKIRQLEKQRNRLTRDIENLKETLREII